jgi:hypothetical protein
MARAADLLAAQPARQQEAEQAGAVCNCLENRVCKLHDCGDLAAMDTPADGQELPALMQQIIDQAELGACHGLLADGHCEAIAKIARAALAAAMRQPQGELYNCIGKGGEYELVGVATGAGESRYQTVAVYRDVPTGALYFREPHDFDKRMVAAKQAGKEGA